LGPVTAPRGGERFPLRAEDFIRDGIISGRFQPNEHLVETDLARMFGLGRAAVRTALARLEHEGLVQLHRNRGARVRLIEPREAVEILEAQAMLESLAVRYAATRRSKHDLEQLRDILSQMRWLLDHGDLLAVSERNARFHRRLSDMSGHLTAARLIAALRSQVVRYQYRAILVPGRGERSYAEHQAIVEAVASGDPDGAEAKMRSHLQHVAEALRGAEREAA
jgi:DNA-binding GntR family transcriptional regulator